MLAGVKRAVAIFAAAVLTAGVSGSARSSNAHAATSGGATPREVTFGSARPHYDYLGWGDVRPSYFSNAGDPSGTVGRIRWKNWGSPIASGRGAYELATPHGGYFKRLVVIYLRVSDIGPCSATAPHAYRLLRYRVPAKPGGRLRPWRNWSGWSQGGDICGFPHN
jgi:hypothetical protein